PSISKARPACGLRRSLRALAISVRSDTHRKRFGMGLGTQRDSRESSLQQRHESRVPVAEHEQNQKWNRDVILVVYRVIHGDCEAHADQQLDPWHPAQAAAVLVGGHFVLLGLDMVFLSAGE